MANTLRKLTGMGGNVRQIAKLLQKKAPPGHMLAYINPEEAAVLKARGGSGRITEEGIPSFEDVFEQPELLPEEGAIKPTVPQDISGGGETKLTPTEGATLPSGEISAQAPTTELTGGGLSLPSSLGGFNTDISQGLNIPSVSTQQGLTPSSADLAPSVGQSAAALQTGVSPSDYIAAAGTKPDQGTLSKLGNYLSQPQTLAKLGIGGIQGLIAANQVRKAQAQGQQAAQAQQAIAAPYQTQGQQLQAQATQGTLTPANQQILQAAQAQAAQGVINRGGVGSMQAQQQIAALTQNLLANQMNLGLQMQQLGDNIAIGAIKAGVQADQYVNQLTSNYATNIARAVFGTTGQVPQTATGGQ